MNAIRFFGRAFAAGSLAALTSGFMASRAAVGQGASSVAPLNAATHCLWPDDAFLMQRPSVKYTGTGALIHLGSSVFWGLLFEGLRRKDKGTVEIVTAAAATAITAYVVDYHVVPKRVTPGFEAHIEPRAFPKIYFALGAGFAIAAMIGLSDTRS